MKLMEAVDLSGEKWEIIVEHDGEKPPLIKDFPKKLKKLKWECGLCQLFWEEECKGCPLDDYEGNRGGEDLGNAYIIEGKWFGETEINESCCLEFFKWCVAYQKDDRRWMKYWAQKMLNRLYEVKLNLENL